MGKNQIFPKKGPFSGLFGPPWFSPFILDQLSVIKSFRSNGQNSGISASIFEAAAFSSNECGKIRYSTLVARANVLVHLLPKDPVIHKTAVCLLQKMGLKLAL